jgi:hypothetical protein
MGLLDSMKNEINRTGGSKSKILFVGDGSKRRIRFLVEFDKGMELVFHDSFSKGINMLCQEEVGKTCSSDFHENEDLRTRKMYAWPVFDYDNKEAKVLLYAANSASPVPAFISMFEAYGTIMDRDYVIERKGKQKNTTYAVVPMDKSKFRNTNVKIPTSKAILAVIDKAFPPGVSTDGFEDLPEETDIPDYDEMKPKELYDECKKRGIDCEPKKKKEYYIDLLKKNDAESGGEEDDWGGDDETGSGDNDEW